MRLCTILSQLMYRSCVGQLQPLRRSQCHRFTFSFYIQSPKVRHRASIPELDCALENFRRLLGIHRDLGEKTSFEVTEAQEIYGFRNLVLRVATKLREDL